jgi:hypothetical protein
LLEPGVRDARKVKVRDGNALDWVEQSNVIYQLVVK